MASFFLVTKMINESILRNSELKMTPEESIHTLINNSDALKLMISAMFPISCVHQITAYFPECSAFNLYDVNYVVLNESNVCLKQKF